jgi:SAM-dependent methyltransferase
VPGDDFPPGFFDRVDPGPDPLFYAPPRLVLHLDDAAVAAVGDLYEELAIDGEVLDLMGSWVSHFRRRPRHLTVLGLNAQELAANEHAHATVLHDLNLDPRVPLPAASQDAVVCCVSVDYLVRPVEVFADVARVLRPGGIFVCTFSNRCFPTKAIRGWLQATDQGRCAIVAEYFARAGCWEDPTVERRTPAVHFGDPLYAVWATPRTTFTG